MSVDRANCITNIHCSFSKALEERGGGWAESLASKTSSADTGLSFWEVAHHWHPNSESGVAAFKPHISSYGDVVLLRERWQAVQSKA